MCDSKLRRTVKRCWQRPRLAYIGSTILLSSCALVILEPCQRRQVGLPVPEGYPVRRVWSCALLVCLSLFACAGSGFDLQPCSEVGKGSTCGDLHFLSG
jgi:hypothetical protein